MKYFRLYIKLVFSLVLIIFVVNVNAQENNPLSAFQNFKIIPPLNITVPTVVSVPMEGNKYTNDTYLVREKETNMLVGSRLVNTPIKNEMKRQVSTLPTSTKARYLIDNDTNTTVNFPVTGQNYNSVLIKVDTAKPITATRLKSVLAQHVSLPISVEIKAKIGEIMEVVVVKKRMTSATVFFPETISNHWEITFTYIQPLRIAELVLEPDAVKQEVKNELLFLAQPNKSYEVYFDSDKKVNAKTTETSVVIKAGEVLKLSSYQTINNYQYIPADIDGDNIRDTLDNCVSVANTNQEDINKNGMGDACEDFDKDGIINSVDNCPNQPNRNQADEDGDDIGDVCDLEESRFTERNAWVPWVGIGIAGGVLILLFVLVGIRPKEEDDLSAEKN